MLDSRSRRRAEAAELGTLGDMRVTFLFAFACLALVRCDSRESSYATYEAAVHDGAIKRGWLPGWLPRTASNIHEWHDQDTNETLASFAYGNAKPEEFLRLCRRDPSAPQSRHRAKWWPDQAEWSRFEIYRCEERTVYGDGHVEARGAWVALDRRARTAYFWR